MTPSSVAMQALEAQMEQVKNLYAELLLTMLGALNESPDASHEQILPSSKVECLAGSCTEAMRDFMASVGVARADGVMTAEVEAQIARFQDELRQGLAATQARLARKIGVLSDKRDTIKGKLQLIQRKRSGARGYRKRVGDARDDRPPFQLNA
jgi:hypothetical protein